MNNKKSKLKERLPRISLYPLTPEEAMSACMKVDSKKVIKAEKNAAKKKVK